MTSDLLSLAGQLAAALAGGDGAAPWAAWVTAGQRRFGSDACALLLLQGDALVPRATAGLSPDTMGRRFPLADHPRLSAILHGGPVVRFPAESALPDPYDGLLAHPGAQLDVHDCVGVALRAGERVLGALTFDSLEPRRLAAVPAGDLEGFAALTAGLLAVERRIASLSDRLDHDRRLSEVLMAEIGGDADLVGHSPAMRALIREVETVAPSDLAVLVLGETGVGKELVARRIHGRSPRAARPLIHVNCAALPDTLVESELFGHVRGAFSGAVQDRRGRFELADGGTLFLDEVGELSLPAQAKLLRALQSGEIQRVGADRHLAVDVRVIAATNQDLAEDVRRGRFRSDLYHRLAVYPLHIPPLRERQRDILPLAGHFLERARSRLRLRNLRLGREVEAAFLSYDWPGNVRELEHLISRAALKATAGEARRGGVVTVTLAHLGLGESAAAAEVPPAPAEAAPAAPRGLRVATDDFQRRLIGEALSRHDGNLAAAARALGLDRGNLHRLCGRLGLAAGRARGG